MSKKMRSILSAKHTITVLYHAIRSYSATYRLTVENEEAWMKRMAAGNAVVLCCWHQQFFPAIRHFKNYSPYRPPLMISKSRDGEVIAGVAMRTGWDIVRGSSSSGGGDALAEMAEKLRERKIAGHIADGPRGPAGKIKAGVIRLAQQANAAIVPMYTAADNAWYFNSWDRFMIPKPFARVTLRFGDVFQVPETITDPEFEALRRKLERIMARGLISP